MSEGLLEPVAHDSEDECGGDEYDEFDQKLLMQLELDEERFRLEAHQELEERMKHLDGMKTNADRLAGEIAAARQYETLPTGEKVIIKNGKQNLGYGAKKRIKP